MYCFLQYSHRGISVIAHTSAAQTTTIKGKIKVTTTEARSTVLFVWREVGWRHCEARQRLYGGQRQFTVARRVVCAAGRCQPAAPGHLRSRRRPSTGRLPPQLLTLAPLRWHRLLINTHYWLSDIFVLARAECIELYNFILCWLTCRHSVSIRGKLTWVNQCNSPFWILSSSYEKVRWKQLDFLTLFPNMVLSILCKKENKANVWDFQGISSNHLIIT